mmetsp:Transcript_37758/g.55453  ORF Transcript_37758/g.55453 Transcript_37758/m.55453 type:complete len:227 (+) Transcript_37758:842-1522(+)
MTRALGMRRTTRLLTRARSGGGRCKCRPAARRKEESHQSLPHPRAPLPQRKHLQQHVCRKHRQLQRLPIHRQHPNHHHPNQNLCRRPPALASFPWGGRAKRLAQAASPLPQPSERNPSKRRRRMPSTTLMMPRLMAWVHFPCPRRTLQCATRPRSPQSWRKPAPVLSLPRLDRAQWWRTLAAKIFSRRHLRVLRQRPLVSLLLPSLSSAAAFEAPLADRVHHLHYS